MDQGRRVDSRYPRTEEVEDRERVAHASQFLGGPHWPAGRADNVSTHRAAEHSCHPCNPYGLKDAKAGRPLYFWSLFTHSTERRQLLKDGWKSVGFVFVFAIVIDGVYQFIVFRWFYPGEALTVAIVLAIVPYLQIRGLANSIARDSIKSKGRESNPVI
jgi:hypothetical protein